MSINTTVNPVPNSSFKVAENNLKVMDSYINGAEGQVLNRAGKPLTPIPIIQEYLEAVVESTAWLPVSGSFQAGGTITERTHILLNTTDNNYYSWGGMLPKLVTTGSTPAVAGGIAANAWVMRADSSLRTQLAAIDSTVLVGGVEAGMIGELFRNPINMRVIQSVAVLRTTPAAFNGETIQLASHSDGLNKGGGVFVATLTGSPIDDGGVNIAATGTQWTRSLDGFVTPEMFGAVGDGVADDTAAVSTFLSSSVKEKEGNSKSYLVSSAFDVSQSVILSDIKLICPSLASNAAAISFSGTEGTAITLLSDHPEGSFTIAVPDGAVFDEQSWVYIASDAQWSPVSLDNVRYGELLFVASISGNTLTLGTSTLLNYLTSDNARIHRLDTLKGLQLNNVDVIGPVSTGNQIGFKFAWCEGVEVNNCNTENFDYVHQWFYRSVNCSVNGGSAKRTGVQEGLDYGVAITNGCYNVSVNRYSGSSLRHVVTIGGSSGVSRFISGTLCNGYDLYDAGMDSHSAVHEHSFINNSIHFADNTSTSLDGIVVQGSCPTVRDNNIYNFKRHGILWQPRIVAGFGGPIAGTFDNNLIDQQRNTGTGSGVNISSGADSIGITSADVLNNKTRGVANGVLVQAVSSEINNVSIVNNKSLSPARGRSVHVFANSANINKVHIDGGFYEVADAATNPVIDIFANTSFSVNNASINSPSIKRGSGGTVGIRFLRVNTATESGTITDNITTKYSVDSESSGIVLDRSRSSVVTVTNSTYIVLPQDDAIICNRASAVALTLPNAAAYPNRKIRIKTIQAFAVNSASSDIVAIDSSTAGTSILPAADGAWCEINSDGTNWIIMQKG